MYNELILPDVRLMLRDDDRAGLAEFCKVLHPAVTAEVLEGLESAEVWQVLSNCDMERQVEIFEFMSLSQQVEVVEVLDRERLSHLLEEMSPDDRVDLITRLDHDRVDDLLPLIAQAERSDIRKLLSYPEDSAGSIMTTEYASLPEDVTVAEALDRLREQAPDSETIYYVYIIDEGRRLRGMISLRELILARATAKLADIMNRDVISVRVDDDQENVANELARYDFLVIPVVDNQHQLVGIVTHDDVLDVIQEEATEDTHRLAAVEPLEDSYLDTPVLTMIWKRGIWLVLLLIAAIATAKILKGYEYITATYTWMVMFIPLVMACGGNAGSQSATLIIRMLALGEVDRSDHLKIARREALQGLALGLSLAAIGFCFAWGLEGLQQAWVVAMTISLVVVLATFCGALLPLFLRKLGMDPALMSNPLIAALVDVMGIVIYYQIALLTLGAVARPGGQ